MATAPSRIGLKYVLAEHLARLAQGTCVSAPDAPDRRLDLGVGRRHDLGTVSTAPTQPRAQIRPLYPLS